MKNIKLEFKTNDSSFYLYNFISEKGKLSDESIFCFEEKLYDRYQDFVALQKYSSLNILNKLNRFYFKNYVFLIKLY